MATLWGMATGCAIDEVTQPGQRVGSPPGAVASSGSDAPESLVRWGDLSDDSLWAHIRASGGTADVGLRGPGQPSGMHRGRVLINRAQLDGFRASIAALGGINVLAADTLLPLLKVRVESADALSILRRLAFVEYVEPGAFTDVGGRRGLVWNDLDWGCSVAGYGGPAWNTWLEPGDVLPWNYRRMFIDSTWTVTTGRGVTVGLVDTGVDENVPELNGWFASSWSAGRSFLKEATKSNLGAHNPWHDGCGHGTRMASVVGAPRNGFGILGVAWGANLYAVRVDDDVVLTEVEATRLGIRRAATNARIVTMAFGTYAYYTSIAQELDYWYFNQDRIMFAAAGTTPCWDPVKSVTFPGTLETVITVTAFDETGSIACNANRGWQVDFAAFTNQPAQGLQSLGQTLAGLSGSSGATAVMAGVTALYLARQPWATRSQVLTALTFAASPTGGRSPVWGFGVPNALCLIGEMCTAWIEGPNLIQSSGTYSWTVRQAASPGPLSWQWGSGETTQTVTRRITVTPGMPETMFILSVTVRDTRNGRTRFDSKSVLVRDPMGCPTCF